MVFKIKQNTSDGYDKIIIISGKAKKCKFCIKIKKDVLVGRKFRA